MRRLQPLVTVILGVLAGARAADAGIDVSSAPAPNFLSGNTTNINGTLAANGWFAYVITLTSDDAPIVSVDLKNDLQGRGGPIGVFGIFHQDSKISADDATTRIATPSTPGPLGAAATQSGRDSLFLNASYYAVALSSPFTEDNNKANSANPPYTGSPLTDTPAAPEASPPVAGNDWGVGSLMTFAGVAPPQIATTSLQLAYVILPGNGAGKDAIRGYATDSLGNTFFFARYIGLDSPPYPDVPEPGSLTILISGALGLLTRRRRTAARSCTCTNQARRK